MSDKLGLQYLEKAFKHAAKKLATVKDCGDFYLKDNPDYAESVFRLCDVESLNCYYGFIYTSNKSKYNLSETLRPRLEGLEVVLPELKGENGTDIDLEIPPGGDHVIILRRVAPSCTYGL